MPIQLIEARRAVNGIVLSIIDDMNDRTIDREFICANTREALGSLVFGILNSEDGLPAIDGLPAVLTVPADETFSASGKPRKVKKAPAASRAVPGRTPGGVFGVEVETDDGKILNFKTTAEAAEHFKVSAPMISLWCNGTNKPRDSRGIARIEYMKGA